MTTPAWHTHCENGWFQEISTPIPWAAFWNSEGFFELEIQQHGVLTIIIGTPRALERAGVLERTDKSLKAQTNWQHCWQPWKGRYKTSIDRSRLCLGSLFYRKKIKNKIQVVHCAAEDVRLIVYNKLPSFLLCAGNPYSKRDCCNGIWSIKWMSFTISNAN